MTTPERADRRLETVVYTAVSLALLLPVAFWPWAWHGGVVMDPGMELGRLWLDAAAALLLVGASVDAVLAGRAIFGGLWVLAAALVVSIALHSEFAAQLLGTAFVCHALPAGWRLMRRREGWWELPGWLRDLVAAGCLFSAAVFP